MAMCNRSTALRSLFCQKPLGLVITAGRFLGCLNAGLRRFFECGADGGNLSGGGGR
jgi:hypothetical protein